MQIHHFRNATFILQMQKKIILVDPMLGSRGTMIPFRLFSRSIQLNPIVDLQQNAQPALQSVTHALITHCQKGHSDHLDRAGIKYLREKNIPVHCRQQDVFFLRKRGLNVQPFMQREKNLFCDGLVDLVPCRHGRGWITHFMEHGSGYFIRAMASPSIYITGDTVLTDKVRQTIITHKPDWIVLPCGGARLDVGRSILMEMDEIIETIAIAPGKVIANHLEALDHCRISRSDLHKAIKSQGLEEKVIIPKDGETINLLVS
ncbi:MAG: MBL fold metallo-hydrolase [Deferribacteres bacterium]|nr:MBL fold metallo-hydrolase [candidate division KSB1 bacterium]MCB9503395.1 MBL fold metallo-hydrolase [Deferribacteres bacterium]